MGPESLQRLLPILEDKMARGRVQHASLVDARNKADSRATSRYDTQREIFAADANTQEALLHRMGTFREALLAGPQTTVAVGAEVDLDLWEEEEGITGAIIAPVAIDLPDVTIITPDSPMGINLMGKKQGDVFTYQIGKDLKAGQISRIQ